MAKDKANLLLPQILRNRQQQILKDWIASQARELGPSPGSVSEDDLRRQGGEFLNTLQKVISTGGSEDINSEAWAPVREVLKDISGDLARQGASPANVALFIFSLKEVLFKALQTETGHDIEIFSREVWAASQILDRLGLFTMQLAMEGREEVISRQQTEMLELSTPVVKLWDGVLALPLIGTLDSERTQVVMESLLEEIVKSGAEIAIIDITGVPTVDTLVAQHLLKTVAAARLMGTECIISGIRPQIAATIVHLGVDLGDVSTKATLADAFAMALRRSNLAVVKAPSIRRQAE